MKIETKSLEETKKVAEDFVKNLLGNWVTKSSAFMVGLYGDFGSGKTTFVKFVASAFGLANTVTSPTFVIEKIYPVRTNGRNRPASNRTSQFENLIHIDAYRLERPEELKILGWEEISKNPRNIIFIEWPENIKDILPSNMQKIHFKFIDENTREIVW